MHSNFNDDQKLRTDKLIFSLPLFKRLFYESALTDHENAFRNITKTHENVYKNASI